MIRFSNDCKLDFACASGALGFTGKGWFWEQPFRWAGLLRPQDMTVVIKTLTCNPTSGNLVWWHPWTCVQPIGNGNWVNAVGLTNSGIFDWLVDCYDKVKKRKYKIALSVVLPIDNHEQCYMARVLNQIDMEYIEVNVSCPNGTNHNIQRTIEALNIVYNITRKPFVVKLSYHQAIDSNCVNAFSSCLGVEAIHVINTIEWSHLYSLRHSPLWADSPGGVSGPILKQYTLQAIKSVREVSELPIIAGGGISSLKDVYDFEAAGANAFSIGTLFLRQPWRPNQIIKAYRDNISKQAYP